MTLKGERDEIPARIRDQRPRHVTDAMLAMKVDVDIVRRDLFVGEKIAVVDEAGRVEGERAR